MTRPKGPLYLMTVLLLLLALFLWADEAQEDILSFQLSFGDHVQTLSLWDEGEGRFYVFLPSCAEPERVNIRLHTKRPVTINGILLEDGMSCASFSDGVSYSFSYSSWGRPVTGEISFLYSANLSSMHIATRSGSMDFIHRAKDNRESGTLALYLPDGTVSYSGPIASIQGRGNFTWSEFEKKPYSLKLTESANLLGLGNAEKWVLLANADDPSHLRNKVIFDFANCLGLAFSPKSDWVDLYLNGEYAGLYLLSERNEVHPERVNIMGEGSFLVSLEKRDRIFLQDYPHVSTTANQYLRIHYPDNLPDAQFRELEHTWQTLENAILAEDDEDPATGRTWMEQIDLDSWVKKYLVEEIFGNYDACFISQFFYRDGDDPEKKICAGPVWDYDHAWGLEAFWQLREPNTLYANRYHVEDGFDTPWFHVLYQKRFFHDRMVEVYQEECLPLMDGFLWKHLESCSGRIARSHEMDRIRWDLSDTASAQQAEYLQSFLKQRTEFLSAVWIQERSYHTVRIDNAMGNAYGYYAVFSGEGLPDLPTLPDSDYWEFLGWYDTETGLPFCPEKPIREDLMIRARWRAKPALWLHRIAKLVPLAILGGLFLKIMGVSRHRSTKRTRKQ